MQNKSPIFFSFPWENARLATFTKRKRLKEPKSAAQWYEQASEKEKKLMYGTPKFGRLKIID